MNKADDLLRELVEAIGRKWDNEPPRRRSNALSPRIEEALHEAKKHLGVPSNYQSEE